MRGRKNQKNDKESNNRKADEKKMSEQAKHSNDSLNTSYEQFNVKEGTEDIVNISATRLDATEETAASTFTP